jgi:hypothetical protein
MTTTDSATAKEETIMPTEKSIASPDGAARRPAKQAGMADTAATPGAETVPAAVPSTRTDTAATRALWAALTGQPGATAADLAVAAEIGRSTATRTLAAWEQAGRSLCFVDHNLEDPSGGPVRQPSKPGSRLWP